MARKNDSPQKAAMREMMRDYLKNNDISIKKTGRHVKRVAAYTEILCRAMGLSEEETWKISVASLMHDVGKICVPRKILHKPGKLTDDEFSEIKKHVVFGY